MIKTYTILAIVLLVSLITKAQKTISVLSGNAWSFYSDFSAALNQCSPGSTIYLPGGAYYLSESSDTILKQVSIIGVGHYPDSTIATNQTILNGTIYFGQSADNSSLQGLMITGGFYILPNSTVNNISVIRCNLSNVVLNNGSNTIPTGTNYFFEENIIWGLYGASNYSLGGGAIKNENLNINKCIVYTLTGLYSANVKNCIIQSLTGASYSNFTDNIFLDSLASLYFNPTNCVFRNNMFTQAGVGSATGNTFIGNVWGQPFNSIFVSVASNSFFDYMYDFHLKVSSSGNNAASDGTDIGIYGTTQPYKEGAVPANPHVSTKLISSSSVSNGTLPVNIRVIAQDK